MGVFSNIDVLFMFFLGNYLFIYFVHFFSFANQERDLAGVRQVVLMGF